MATIVTRVTGATAKNAPLSNTEIDTNFINLNNDKVETADAVSTNTANKVVKRDENGNFVAGTISASLSGTATQANNINGGAAGGITYQSNANTTSHVAAGTSGQVLKSNGAAAPSWVDQSTITAGNATKLQTSRTISIGTGATGTATSFDGQANITIPITDVNAGYIGTGTLNMARLGTTGAPQFGSLGVGTAASGNAGQINATDLVLSDALTFNNSTSQTSAAAVNMNVTVLTSGTSYTRPAKLLYALVIATGGGGGAGGSDQNDTGAGSGSGGGGAGGTAIRMYTAAQLGATCAYSIGGGGGGGSGVGGSSGASGGNTAFVPSGGGASLLANGGTNGSGTGLPTVDVMALGGAGGGSSGGIMNITGGDGDNGYGTDAAEVGIGGSGGASFWGGGGRGSGVVTTAAGATGIGGKAYGSGGGGAGTVDNITGADGGAGQVGAIVILEYLAS